MVFATPSSTNSSHRKEMIMEKMQKYFENTKGVGVLATADSKGRVDAAIYSRPHFLEEKSLAFIMRDRLTHHNLQSNPSATFLFIEEGTGFKGKRLFLKKIREENNPELVKRIKRRQYTDENEEPIFVVYFTVEKELPLVGV
jgi:Pyridoxamine 5'-phosphate oxidase